MYKDKLESLYFEKGTDGFPPHQLMKFVEWINEQINKVPPEYRDEAGIEFNYNIMYDFTYPTIEISYRRPMTQEELDADAEHKKQQIADQKALLLAQLAKLDAALEE